MTREVKEEVDRINPPLFPRVHVNDTERGRWSQSRIPSLRHVSDSPSTLSLLPPTNKSSSRSCIAGDMFIPFCNTASPLKFADKLNPSSNSVSKSNFTVESLEWKKAKGSEYPNFNGSFSSANKPDLSKQNDCHFKSFSIENPDSLDHVQAPRAGRSETGTNLALQLHNSSSVLEEKQREYPRNRCQDKATIHPRDFYNYPAMFELLKRPSAPRNQETLCFSQNVLSNMAFRESSLLGDAETKGSNKERTQFYNVYRSERVMGVDNNHENVSGCSGMDSAAGWNASPNKVVKAIGHKRFQKMRTAMIRQQKIFAGQVFELHRLVSVQKRLARSPKLLLEGKCSPSKKPATLKDPSSHLLEMAPKVKPDTEKLKPETESTEEEGVIPKFPLPSITKELVPTKQCSSMVTATQSSSSSSSPWWFSAAPGSQWLVPVVSPSEGLIYKPYTGPSPSTSGFMFPFYSNDSIEDALGFPLSHPLQEENPFGQVQSLSSLSSRVSKAVPFSLQNSRESRDSDVQGSTASSPPERHKREVLPLFPTEPTRQKPAETDTHRQQAPLRAIKTTPHSTTSAPESVARIFRAIQEERAHVHADHMIS